MAWLARRVSGWKLCNTEAQNPKTNTAVLAAAQLVSEVLSKLEGAYGLLVKSAYYPGELVAAKLGSPLLLGVKEAGGGGGGGPQPRTPLNSPARKKAAAAGGAFEAFIASDASAFVEHTKQCAAALEIYPSAFSVLPSVAMVVAELQVSAYYVAAGCNKLEEA